MTYQTEQRSQLIAFLKKHKDRAYTIDAIVSGMQADPAIKHPPGKSTLYRLMPKLMEENPTLYRLKELEHIEGICENVGNINLNGNGDVLSQLMGLMHPGTVS